MDKLWAPWRMAYVGKGEEPADRGCFFCRAWRETGKERENLLLARSGDCLVMLNRYPYSNAHLLIAPSLHLGSLEEMPPEIGAQLWNLIVFAKTALARAISPHGFNIGVNQGRVAGAGVLDHLHIHVVPRWNGDVNFMPVLAEVKIIPQALEETWEKLAPHFQGLSPFERNPAE
ncbi:MAG: HIT domain-containing protein [Planctomycetota bacterium]|jgi:ATP adenylyltransferase|nr:HIT domain-containing protein [Planctomycetota bacterium]